MKRLMTLAVAGTLGLYIGLSGFIQAPSSEPGVPTEGHALWASDARTIGEEAAEADAIVRVQVLGSAPVRQFVEPLESAAQRPGLKEFVTPFTDTRFRVLDVYDGAVGHEVTVMQMGGDVPATDTHPRMDIVIREDPPYATGTQHILFLKDISGDPVHAPKRRLYRIVNAYGRYDLAADRASVRGERGSALGLPTSRAMLEAEIERALTDR